MMRAPVDRMMRPGSYAARREDRPGTLTVRYGRDVVTIDPLSPPERLRVDERRAEELFARMKRDFGIG